MSYIRTCQFCKEQTQVYYDDAYFLFKYGVRHYAHAVCLARRLGVVGALEKLPSHEHKDFKWRLSLVRPDSWEMVEARVIDKNRAEAALRQAVRP